MMPRYSENISFHELAELINKHFKNCEIEKVNYEQKREHCTVLIHCKFLNRFTQVCELVHGEKLQRNEFDSSTSTTKDWYSFVIEDVMFECCVPKGVSPAG